MKPTLFIIEGPDTCGKTTFAKSLSAHLGESVYWHMTCTKTLAPAMLDYQLSAVENAKVNLGHGKHVVFDRLWPSELCYGKILRPDTMINPDRIRTEVSELEPVYIFCLDSVSGEAGADRAVKRHKAHLDPAHPYDDAPFKAIYMEYLNLSGKMRMHPVTHNRTFIRPFDEKIVDHQEIAKYNHQFIEALMKLPL